MGLGIAMTSGSPAGEVMRIADLMFLYQACILILYCKFTNFLNKIGAQLNHLSDVSYPTTGDLCSSEKIRKAPKKL